MSKQISANELANLVTQLLNHPEQTGELDSHEKYSSFMTAIASVICDHCGGDVTGPADNFADDTWFVGISGNDSMPDAFGGIWRDLDPEGEL